MILRRVIEHFRKQEWTAIFLDFVIVVLGVFVGIQLGNLNEARKDDRWERAFFRDLLVEMQENRTQLAEIADFQTRKSAALEDVRRILDRGADEEDRKTVEERFFFSESSNRTFFPTKGVYLSAMSSGKIDQIGDAATKYAIMNLYEHYYTRLVYNGEIYDDRADQVSWDLRTLIDSGNERFRSADALQTIEFRADIDFMSAQSAVYASLANINLKATDELIAMLRGGLGEGRAP